MIRAHLRHLFIMKICNFITVRFYVDFQKIYILERFAVKFFFNIRTDFIVNSVLFFQKVIIFNQKRHPISLIIIIFYIRVPFWKHYVMT